jgi:hypothetical protein
MQLSKRLGENATGEPWFGFSGISQMWSFLIKGKRPSLYMDLTESDHQGKPLQQMGQAGVMRV